MKSNLVITIFSSLLLVVSCRIGTSSYFSNEEIDVSLRNEINQLDALILESLVDSSLTTFTNFMSPKLKEIVGDEIETLFNEARLAYTTKEYEIVDQYHVKNSTSNLSNTLFSGVSGQDDYFVNLQSLNAQTFVSIILPKGNVDGFFILNVYGKYPEGWKLNMMRFGHYKIENNTAPELYRRAKDEYSRGHLIDAANTMFLSSQILKPSKEFSYMAEEKMMNYFQKLSDEIKGRWKFPIEMSNIMSKPRIMNIFPQKTKQGYLPTIEYVTNIDITDTTKLKLEYEALKKEIPLLFNGIDKNKDFVLYKAFSRIPDGRSMVPTYGFVHEITKEED